MGGIQERKNINASFKQPETVRAVNMNTGNVIVARKDISILSNAYHKKKHDVTDKGTR